MAVPKRQAQVVRLPRGRRRHALAIDGRAECGEPAPSGWIQVGIAADDVDCRKCRKAMVIR